MMFNTEPGYAGYFTRNEAPGAIKNGARIRKVAFEKGDAHPLGSLGTVLGSIKTPPELRIDFPLINYCYFVEWDATPKVAVGVVDAKIAEVT